MHAYLFGFFRMFYYTSKQAEIKDKTPSKFDLLKLRSVYNLDESKKRLGIKFYVEFSNS